MNSYISTLICIIFLILGVITLAKLENLIDSNKDLSENLTLYLSSFLIPLVGFIAGSILLTQDDKEKKLIGDTTISLSFSSIFIFLFSYFIYKIIIK